MRLHLTDIIDTSSIPIRGTDGRQGWVSTPPHLSHLSSHLFFSFFKSVLSFLLIAHTFHDSSDRLSIPVMEYPQSIITKYQQSAWKIITMTYICASVLLYNCAHIKAQSRSCQKRMHRDVNGLRAKIGGFFNLFGRQEPKCKWTASVTQPLRKIIHVMAWHMS